MSDPIVEMCIEKIRYSMKLLTSNETGSISKIVIEPWADEVTLKKGDKAEIVGIGFTNQSFLEMEFVNDSLIIYGWKGSLIEIRVNDILQITASKDVPCI